MDKKMTLRKARLLCGLKQKEVAKKLKVSLPTMTNIETGKHIPKADLFMSMCRLYEVEPKEIELKLR